MFYYTYVNMHMFVEHDNSFRDIYYPNPYQKPSLPRKMSEETLESESEEDASVSVLWVETLLQGE